MSSTRIDHYKIVSEFGSLILILPSLFLSSLKVSLAYSEARSSRTISIMLMLPPDEIAYEEAHINDNRGPILVGVTTILLVLGILAALGRFASRRMTKAALATDDWLVLFSLVCVLVFL